MSPVVKKVHAKVAKHYHSPDWVLFAVLGVLLVVGLVMLSSASVVVASDKFADSYYYVKQQLVRGILPGLFLMAIAYIIDYRVWRKLAPIGLLFSVLLLLAVFIPGVGTATKGAQRWIGLGFISFQPSEIVKLFFIVYLAAWMTKHKQAIQEKWTTFFPFLALVGGVGFLIFLQPDIGTFGLLALVSLGMYVLAQAPWRQIFSMVGLGFGLMLVAIRLEPYRLSRVLVFLNPGTDPQGIGYQLTQALLAVGTGGLWGLGLGRSVQKYAYLPEVIGDSIFAIIAEELGFFLTVGVLALFAILVYRGILIARNAPDNFGRLLAAGITLWIGFQAFINIGAMIGILPLTGLPLPFMSFGNTALVSMLISMGLLLNISRQTR